MVYGNTTMENLDYNIRGWLTSKESVLFKMELCCDNPQAGTSACYHGNISEWQWQQGMDAVQIHSFTCDNVNRLKESTHKKKSGSFWLTNANHYLEKGLMYDLNGNIQTLQRIGNGTFVDNVAYSYTGNQLIALQEISLISERNMLNSGIPTGNTTASL